MGFDFSGGPLGAGKSPKFGRGFAQPSPVEDPLKDVPVTGNVETDSAAELDALSTGFRKRRDMEASRFKNATDSEFWFAVCFHDREDKEAFIRAVADVDTIGDKYIDGYALAKALGISLEKESDSDA